tara:strand:+ start:1214 stop:1849 length:636 start_codon:yes stop_codon:yes gene_type:complete
MTIKSPVKLFALGLGTIFGLTQIGLIGMIARQSAEESRFPTLPVGPYTSYRVKSNADGSYDMAYRANDPLVMSNVKDIEKKGGFLGSKKENIKTTEMYTMDGSIHHGGPVSSTSAWIDPSAMNVKGNDDPTISAKTIACIEAAGSGRGTGKVVGSSIAAGTVAPALSNIPFVGWVAAGFVTMFGADKGGDIGADLSTSYAGCDDVDTLHTK